MGVLARSRNRLEFERTLQRHAPIKKTLIRANPFNCTAPGCFQNGRSGPSMLCTACNGTGYTGVSVLPNNAHLLKPPAATLLYFFGDLQPGHGLYGVGGDFLRALQDLGRIDMGDATLFCKVDEIDRVSGVLFHPDIQGSNVRPDYVKGSDGTIYTVLQSLLVNFGDETLCRVVSLERGAQGKK